MILIDANILLYAYNESAEENDSAKRWLEEVLSGSEPVALTWSVILAFMRIATNARAFPQPLSRAQAAIIVSEWLERPQIVIVGPGEKHWEIIQRLCSEGKVSGPLFSDAHLAAVAIEHGATLHTTDRDFRRFPSVKCRDPLSAA